MLDKIIKYKFWIATGLGLVVAIVLFVVLVRPLAARNEVDRKEFKQRVRTLEKIAARPELYNEFYIRQIDARKKELDLQKNKLDSLLKEWHQPLERSFTDIDGKVITDAGQWLPRYNSECARLIANLQKARIELPGDGKAMFDFERWEGPRMTGPRTSLKILMKLILFISLGEGLNSFSSYTFSPQAERLRLSRPSPLNHLD